MVRAGQHLADHDAVKPALYGLDLLETLDFESDVGQYPCDFFGRKIGVEIAFKPDVYKRQAIKSGRNFFIYDDTIYYLRLKFEYKKDRKSVV